MATQKSIRERFFAKVDTNGPIPAHRPDLGQCNVWTGKKFSNGYGTTSHGPHATRKCLLVHRVAWEFENGPIPDGLRVLHHCDNRPCVRLSHLFLGTTADNMRDMAEKKRSPSGDSHWSRRRPGLVSRGEAHGNSKLTESDVRAIMGLVLQGEARATIAKRFGISVGHVADIGTGRKWSHVHATKL